MLRLPEVKLQKILPDYSTEAIAAIARLENFVPARSDRVALIALRCYEYFNATGAFDSRLACQDEDGGYKLDTQMACLELGHLLEDNEFKVLAKREMLHAWIDLVEYGHPAHDITQKLRLEHVQKLLQFSPFTHDLLLALSSAAAEREAEASNVTPDEVRVLLSQTYLAHEKTWNEIFGREYTIDTSEITQLSSASYSNTLDRISAMRNNLKSQTFESTDDTQEQPIMAKQSAKATDTFEQSTADTNKQSNCKLRREEHQQDTAPPIQAPVSKSTTPFKQTTITDEDREYYSDVGVAFPPRYSPFGIALHEDVEYQKLKVEKAKVSQAQKSAEREARKAAEDAVKGSRKRR